MSPLQAYVMRVIRIGGGTVSIVDGAPRIGWSRTSFTARTVRALAKAGHLARTGDAGEVYRVTEQATPPDERR